LQKAIIISYKNKREIVEFFNFLKCIHTIIQDLVAKVKEKADIP